MTQVGHKTGSHMETQTVSAAAGGPLVYAFDVEVDDYGISKANLATYVARVNS